MTLFLKKELNVWEITNYKICIKKYLVNLVMPTFTKFCNLDCLASSYIWHIDAGHVCQFVSFNITLLYKNVVA